MLGLEDVGCLDAFPGRSDFDEDAVFGDTLGFVELFVGVSLFSAITSMKKEEKD